MNWHLPHGLLQLQVGACFHDLTVLQGFAHSMLQLRGPAGLVKLVLLLWHAFACWRALTLHLLALLILRFLLNRSSFLLTLLVPDLPVPCKAVRQRLVPPVLSSRLQTEADAQ
jgi:hypothetical protein